MYNLHDEISILINRIINNGITPCISIESDTAYIIDPVYGIVRNRVNAECVKALLRVFNDSDANSLDLINKIFQHLLNMQATDGSWNEIHVKYNHPSALITSIVGEAFVDGYVKTQNPNFKIAANKAKGYVLGNQISTGFFKKSSVYIADHLNVDATCGAFLAKYGKVFSDEECIDVAKQTAHHIFMHQFEDGVFPYTTENKGNYAYDMQLPCVHYQCVTIYYLFKIIDNTGLNEYDPYIKKGIKWIRSVQFENGKFDWSKSGLMFAYFLSGAYAFSIPCFIHASKWDSSYKLNAKKALNVLINNTNYIVNRWEKQSFSSFPTSILTAWKTAMIGNYPFRHRFFRFGYGVYRQFSRCRYSDKVDPKIFNLLSSFMRINTSTIEPDNNFPDLFMTSEVLDCLSYSLSIISNENEEFNETSCS